MASIEIREKKNRENGSKRSSSHAGSNLSYSLSQIEKLKSTFRMSCERGGGDETSNNVKSHREEQVSKRSEQIASAA